MQLTLEQAATRLGKSKRQILYMIQQGHLPAQKLAGRWWIESQHLPLSEAQQRSYDRKQHQLRAAVEDALDIEPETPGQALFGCAISKPFRSPCRCIAKRRRHSVPTIHYPTLCRLLFRKLHDPRTQALIQLLLASGGAVYRTPLAVQVLELERYPVDNACGLALGSYLSQWCGTFIWTGWIILSNVS